MKLENIASEKELRSLFEQEMGQTNTMADAAQSMRDRAERKREIRKKIQYLQTQIRDLRQELTTT